MKAINIRTEYLVNPVGIDIINPRISWNDVGGNYQSAFEIRGKINEREFDSGKISSSSMFYFFNLINLSSRDIVTFQIRLWDKNDKEGGWSEVNSFEMGLLNKKDFLAKWIRGNYSVNKKSHYPVDCFAKEFVVPRVKKARLYITSFGVYQAYINDNKVGDAVLTPGSTNFNKTIYYQTYDVTDLLKNGSNILHVELSNGYYRKEIKKNVLDVHYGKYTKLFFQLEIWDEDDKLTTIISDNSTHWSNDGPYTYADVKSGEDYDANKAPSYSSNAVETTSKILPCCSNGLLMKEHEVFEGTLINENTFDFKQNIAGFLQFEFDGHQGEEIEILLGELVYQGEFTQRNIHPYPNNMDEVRFQKIKYIAKEGHNHFKSTFAIYGFRYACVKGNVKLSDIKMHAIAVSSALQETISFHCGNELINKFVDATRWSAKNNHADVPTDCPTRERSGWTGDAQIFVDTANYLFDYAPFARKYIRDINDEQYKNGSFVQIAPRPDMPVFMKILDGSVGWSDAGVIIPYKMYKHTGDIRFLSDNYINMKKYALFMMHRCGKKSLRGKSPKLNKINKMFLVNKGYCYGEWKEPTELVPFDFLDLAKAHPEESTAYTSYVMSLMEEVASILGNREDAYLFNAFKQGSKKAYQELVELDGFKLDTDRQAKLVRPLYFDLLNDKQKEYAQNRLIKALDNFSWRVGTGFLSTPFILDVLSKINPEYAYKLLLNENMPGWLVMVKGDGNTVWEDWEGDLIELNKIQSLDHYSKGAIIEWLFTNMMGINNVGERKYIFSPQISPLIKEGYVEYLSPYGKIVSSWKYVGNKIIYDIEVPSNVFATLLLDNEVTLKPGANHYERTL